MKASTQVDASSITFTKDYLQAFEKTWLPPRAAPSWSRLCSRSTRNGRTIAMSLDIGAKVNKGEIKW